MRSSIINDTKVCCNNCKYFKKIGEGSCIMYPQKTYIVDGKYQYINCKDFKTKPKLTTYGL